jgi:hypothetical protein
LFIKSSSNSSSFICLSRTDLYSLSRKSACTSCQARMFSFRKASAILRATSTAASLQYGMTYWLRARATTRGKSSAVAPLSVHILRKNFRARA